MIGFHHRQALSLALGFAVLLLSVPGDSDAAVFYQAASLSGSDYSGQGIPFTTEELQNMVAPVALLPDPLLAQILVGATFPDQVLLANIWLQQNKNLPEGILLQAINSQAWDPSIKGLAQFPAVLNDMAQNLTWTSQLGEAYHNQASAMMAAIQLMRGKAKTDGNLRTSTEMILAQPSGDIIALQPGNPLLVYVPQYNPTMVYGATIEIPNYSATGRVSGNGMYFGVGVGIGASAGADWGWRAWQCNWYHGTVDYRGYPYYGNHAWRGGYYGGYTYYGNHPYHDDANRPFAQPNAPSAPAAVQTVNAKHTFSLSGTTPAPTPAFNAWAREAGGWAEVDDLRGWGKTDPGTLTAFSTWSNQAGSVFGVGGWGDRSSSYRGWLTRGGNTGWGIGGRSTGLHW
jgi:hypothetical protein